MVYATARTSIWQQLDCHQRLAAAAVLDMAYATCETNDLESRVRSLSGEPTWDGYAY